MFTLQSTHNISIPVYEFDESLKASSITLQTFKNASETSIFVKSSLLRLLLYIGQNQSNKLNAC
jgi:hypothetical protein